MSATKKKPLFDLTAAELEAEISDTLKASSASHPIMTAVATALMIAFNSTCRITQNIFDMDAAELEALSPPVSEVQTLNDFLVEPLLGQHTRIDLVPWDAAGYIHGWFVNQRGDPVVQLGSCTEVVARIAAVLQTLDPHEHDRGHRALLEQHARRLTSLLLLAREKAELQARTKIQSQGWLRKRIFPTSLEGELALLGFL